MGRGRKRKTSVDADNERAKSLARHVIYMRALLEHPQLVEGGFHVWLAGALRTLLTDRNAVLLRHAAARNTPLYIRGPSPAGTKPDPDLLFSLTIGFAEIDSGENDRHRLRIEEYLQTHIATSAGWIIPAEVIHAVASNEGAAHLGYEKPVWLQMLKGGVYRRGELEVREFDLVRFIVQLSDWAVDAIEKVLGHQLEEARPAT